MKVEMTQEDIEGGERQKQAKCPIARAITRQTGLVAFVAKEIVQIISSPWPIESLYYKLPLEAREFIELFDSGSEVTPISFTMERIDI